jgi:hypothetical protein
VNYYREEIFSFLILIIWAMVVPYQFYMTWFRPAKFLEDSVNRVKDWWPSPEEFRFLYGSLLWLWLWRIVSTGLVLFFLYIVYRIAFTGLPLGN